MTTMNDTRTEWMFLTSFAVTSKASRSSGESIERNRVATIAPSASSTSMVSSAPVGRFVEAAITSELRSRRADPDSRRVSTLRSSVRYKSATAAAVTRSATRKVFRACRTRFRPRDSCVSWRCFPSMLVSAYNGFVPVCSAMTRSPIAPPVVAWCHSPLPTLGYAWRR